VPNLPRHSFFTDLHTCRCFLRGATASISTDTCTQRRCTNHRNMARKRRTCDSCRVAGDGPTACEGGSTDTTASAVRMCGRILGVQIARPFASATICQRRRGCQCAAAPTPRAAPRRS
jgi:hypothetical protein